MKLRIIRINKCKREFYQGFLLFARQRVQNSNNNITCALRQRIPQNISGMTASTSTLPSLFSHDLTEGNHIF